MAKKSTGFRKTTQRSKSVDKFVEDAGRDPFADPQAPAPKPAAPAAEEAWRLADPEETARLVFNLRLNTLENGALDYLARDRKSKQQVVREILIPELLRQAGVDVDKE